MSNSKLKPDIRFKGFTDDWEQREFSKITYLSGIKNKENINYESYSISNTDGFIPQELQFENGGTMKEADKSMYYIVTPNSFAYNPARINVGSIGYYNLDKNVIVSSLYEVFQTNDNIDDRCLWHWFKSNNLPKLIEKYQEGGVRQYFYYDKLCMCSIKLPTEDEQKKIGRIFDYLDNLITLHQRKCEKLSLLKKSFLEKMFPADGETKPKIRFKGFTDDWEQRKFDDVIVRIATGLNPRDNFTLNTGGKNYYVTIKNFEHGHLYLDDKCDKVDDKALELIQARSDLQKDDVLFTSIGTIGDCYLIQNKPINWNINESVFSLRPNKKEVVPEYIYHVIHSDKVLKRILNDVTGSTFKSIKIADLKKIDVPITNKNEQEKLATFLTHIEEHITLHQRELKMLENLKKSLLQKMFC